LVPKYARLILVENHIFDCKGY